jgi:hypothetical protein
VAVQEVHSDFAESAQGVATDGRRWFVVSNRATDALMRKMTDPLALLQPYRNSRRIGVYAHDGAKLSEIGPDPELWAELVARNKRSHRRQRVHLGAPCWAQGHLLVPTQRPSGVWVLAEDLTRQDWWPDPAPVRPERWSWLDQRPETGLLYTSLHWHPSELQALEWQTLRRVPEADIRLGAAPVRLDRVQGGAFTDDGRVLLSSSNGGGQVFSFAASDGALVEVLEFGTFHEMEGLAVRRCRVGGELADVHVLDAGTHYWPFLSWGDWFSVRSYRMSP